MSSFLFWIYAFSGLAKRDPPDSLQRPRLRRAGRAPLRHDRRGGSTSCRPPRPPGTRSSGPTPSTPAPSLLRTMVADLRAMAPADGPDRALVLAWLDDWDTYLASRDDYARRVRTDPRARFLVDQRDRQAITVPMDNLATVNRMASCVTPGDV